jgi:peptidoglycan hydrolase CwlO-like protein
LHKRDKLSLFNNKIKKLKHMQKNVSRTISRRFVASLLVFSSLILVGSSFVPSFRQVVSADQYSDQLNALQAQNNANRAAVSSLRNEAATYQDLINNLQAQIDGLQASINANQALQTELQNKITEAQAEIDRQRLVLAADIKTMYVDGTPSSLEMLATSKNLSDFVDKQAYRSRFQNKIQETLKKIAALEKQLQEQKAQVEQLLKELQTQQAQIDADRAKQQELLNYNQSQQASYLAQVQANNAQMAQIRAAQQAALARIIGSGGQSSVGSPIKYKNYTGGSSCGGGYSYCWAGFDQIVSDPWGLNYARECVHYAADWLARDGRSVPRFAGGGGGNANQWYRYAPEVSNPQRGDVIYMPLAPVGHVGIVEYVNGDGTVHVSQMNWPYGGYYSEMDVYITSGIQFFRF